MIPIDVVAVVVGQVPAIEVRDHRRTPPVPREPIFTVLAFNFRRVEPANIWFQQCVQVPGDDRVQAIDHDGRHVAAFGVDDRLASGMR